MFSEAGAFSRRWPMPSMQPMQAGRWVVEAGVYLIVICVFISMSYGAYETQVHRTRSKQLRDTLVMAADALQRGREAGEPYPIHYQADAVSALRITYRRNDNGNSFALHGSVPGLRLWAGVTAEGLRCACRDCEPPAAFVAQERACPTGTWAF